MKLAQSLARRLCSLFNQGSLAWCHGKPLFSSLHLRSTARAISYSGNSDEKCEVSVARDSKPRFSWIEDVEYLERYRCGGYHPISLGDLIGSRYKIVHKLGFGTFSTAWLALDSDTHTYVALKVVTGTAKPLPESRILSLLNVVKHKDECHPGISMVPSILDRFEIEGPNGRHECLVMDLARASIAEIREASHKGVFIPSVARALSAQLAHAVAFLHLRGVVHSDLHEDNILLRLPRSMNDLTPQNIYEAYGNPEQEPIIRLDGKPLDLHVPSHAIIPIWLGMCSEDLSLAESSIVLIDFGEAFLPSESPRDYTRAPFMLRPPERLLFPNSAVSFPNDIWALACTIFSILGQRTLFESWFPNADSILSEQVNALGWFPAEWWSQWANRSAYFDEHLNRCDGEPLRTLEKRVEQSIQEPRREFGLAEIEEEEKTALLALLKRMLAFNPEERPSAQEVLEAEWMVKWALPEYKRMQGGDA